MAVAVPSREEGAVVPSPVSAAEAAALRADDVLARLGSGAPGLPEDEAARQLRATGPNPVRSHRVHALSVLAGQLRSPLLILLAVGLRGQDPGLDLARHLPWHVHDRVAAGGRSCRAGGRTGQPGIPSWNNYSLLIVRHRLDQVIDPGCRAAGSSGPGRRRRAEGDAPGWREEIRTRSAAGRMANRSGGLRFTASPSTPACTAAGH